MLLGRSRQGSAVTSRSGSVSELSGKTVKRFTDTEKWSDPWYRKLSLLHKLLWDYICSRCDLAGVWKPDLELASFCIGEPIDEAQAIQALGHRIQILPGGNWFIPKFIPFQYGPLHEDCRPHQAVIRALQDHNIPYDKGMDTLTYCVQSHSHHKLKGIDTLKDKDKDRDKDKEKDRKGDARGEPISHPPGPTPEQNDRVLSQKREFELKATMDYLTAALFKAYHRDPNRRICNSEEPLLAEISRRPDAKRECDRILNWKSTIPANELRYFPQSIERLLQAWSATLDKADAQLDLSNVSPAISAAEERATKAAISRIRACAKGI